MEGARRWQPRGGSERWSRGTPTADGRSLPRGAPWCWWPGFSVARALRARARARSDAEAADFDAIERAEIMRRAFRGVRPSAQPSAKSREIRGWRAQWAHGLRNRRRVGGAGSLVPTRLRRPGSLLSGEDTGKSPKAGRPKRPGQARQARRGPGGANSPGIREPGDRGRGSGRSSHEPGRTPGPKSCGSGCLANPRIWARPNRISESPMGARRPGSARPDPHGLSTTVACGTP